MWLLSNLDADDTTMESNMAIRRGTGQIRRIHAKNYITEEAQMRFDEAVRPYQQQGLNALQVDSFEIDYFYRRDSTVICTCQQTEVPASTFGANFHLPENFVKPESDVDKSIKIDYRRPLFGNIRETEIEDTAEVDELALDEDDDGTEIHNSLIQSGVDCGICYRTNFVPGYSRYGFERVVLTTFDIENSYGYSVDKSTAPHTFNLIDERDGYVRFIVQVPKFFKAVNFSIRNNLELVDECLYSSNLPLTLQDIRNAAGSSIAIDIRYTDFTHIVIEFDLGLPKIKANLSQLNRSTDWTLFSTVGNVTFIVPNNLGTISTSDVIYVPSKNYSFKVSDFNHMDTARGEHFEWNLSTRILQPQESLVKIHKSSQLR